MRPALAVIRKFDEQGRHPAIGQTSRHVPRQRKIRPQNVQDDHARPLGPEAHRSKILRVDHVVLGVGRLDRRRKPQLRDHVPPSRHHRLKLIGKHRRLEPKPLGDRRLQRPGTKRDLPFLDRGRTRTQDHRTEASSFMADRSRILGPPDGQLQSILCCFRIWVKLRFVQASG